MTVKHLVAILAMLTTNEFSYSFKFEKKMCNFNFHNYYMASFNVKLLIKIITNILLDSNLHYYMASFDVKYLFTNISLNEIIDICTDKIYYNGIHELSTEKKDFHK